jgi:myo-inositol 2-dehydrogenase/D-chiro-inositol 1-dehydrogenase
MDSQRKLRVAVVGTGDWWGYHHARIYHERPDTELAGILGRHRAKADTRAAEFGVTGYVDLERLLEAEKPDLVSVCLPNEGHFETTLAIIRAGVPLFVEKPLVFDLEEADVLIEEAAQQELFFALDFNHRYARPVQLARAAIEAGDLGPLVFATWRFGGEVGTSRHPHANLIETQCHGLDMLEHLCGPIESVMAELTDLTGRGYTTLVVALRFASGAVGSLVGSYDSSYAYPDTHLVEVNGLEGRLLIEDTVRRYTFNRAGDEMAQVWQAGYFNDRDREFHRIFDRHVDAMLAAFRAGQEPPVHARAGRRAVALAMAIVDSFERGVRVVTGP